MPSFTPSVALLIGAGSAIGAEIARQLNAAGVQLVLNDLLPTRIEPLAAEIAASGGQVSAFPADVSRKLSLQTMLQEVLEKFERIDILVFIANVHPPDVILDMDEWDWHRTIDLNLTAAFLCMQSVGRVMRELGGGVIVNVLDVPRPTHSSQQATPQGRLSNVEKPISAAYEVATAGIAALSRAAEGELGRHNIRVHTTNTVDQALSLLSF